VTRDAHTPAAGSRRGPVEGALAVSSA